MLYRLAAQCGEWNVEGPGGLIEKMPYWQFERWVEYYRKEPSGWQALNERIATGFCMLTNTNRAIFNLFSDKQNRFKPAPFELFMGIKEKPRKRAPQTVEEFREMKAIMLASSVRVENPGQN